MKREKHYKCFSTRAGLSPRILSFIPQCTPDSLHDMDDWVGPSCFLCIHFSSFIYKPCQNDAASLPDTSCHSSDFIGFTQLRDLSVGRDVQTTEKMRLRNGTIFIDMLSLLLTCALASVLSFLLSSQSRVTPPSLSLSGLSLLPVLFFRP